MRRRRPPLARLRVPVIILAFVLSPVLRLAWPPAPDAAARDGAYGVRTREGVSWLTGADGLAFFSVGVNVIDRGVPERDYHSSKPSYAAFRLYRSPEAWARATLDRLRGWGVNTIGGWSDDEVLQPRGEGQLAATPVLEIGRTLGVPWSDVFADDYPARADGLARKTLARWQGRRDVIGYFLDNELGWWGDSIFLSALRQPAGSRTHARLIQLLRDRYRNDFSRLRRDFTSTAASFDDLARGGILQLTADGQGVRAVDAFLGVYAERYYEVTADAVRRHAPGRLILGDRYVGYYEWPVARAAAPHVDVISTNQGADWPDGRTSRFYLDTLHRLTGRPVLVSELYFAATENRSGNRNTGGLFPTVRTQAARAASARRQLEGLADLPFVVGAHWFQYYDEPTFGRADGEDYNMGLVDIADRPYDELTSALATLDAQARHARATIGAATDAEADEGVGASDTPEPREPRAPGTAPKHPASPAPGGPPPERSPAFPTAAARSDVPYAALGAPLAEWDLDRAFLPPTTVDPRAGAFADAYVSRHGGGFAVAIYAPAFADPALYADRRIAADARLVATVQAGGNPKVVVPFGPDAAALTAPAGPGITRGCRRTRCWTIVQVPLQAGIATAVPLHVTLAYRGRTMAWTATLPPRER